MFVETRGRKPTFSSVDVLIQALKDIENGKKVSRYLCIKLVEIGMVQPSTIRSEGRGRPRVVYILSEKGRQQIGM